MSDQKTLILDIETSPLLVYVWGIREQFIGLDQIHSDWYIMAWSAKWLGEKEIHYYDRRDCKPGDDKPILQPLWKLLNEADIVITQNGKRFDSRKINARFMLNDMKRPKPYRHFDTYLLARNIADFTSNRLEYLTDKFCKKHKKTSHAKYSGWKLWIECLKGNREAWNEMKAYNIADVLSTEELYLTIRAWAPESFPRVYPLTNAAMKCGTCGFKGRMIAGKVRHSNKGKYRQHNCPKCGAWQKGKKVK